MALFSNFRPDLTSLTSRFAHVPWLDGPAKALHAAGEPLFGAGGPRLHKDALYGTWLGHPLHPPLTDLPIGFWTSSALLDLAGKKEASDLMLELGTVSALGAAASGYAQWHDLQEMTAPRRLGVLHAMLNGTATACYGVSWFLRRRDQRSAGMVFSTAGLALATGSAMIGGDLSFRLGIGVSRVAFEEPSGKWKPVADEADLEPGVMHRVEASFGPLVLLKDGETILATSATCTHVGAPLDEGEVDGTCVTCPWHGSVFDLRDGRLVHGPATAPLHAFETRVNDGKVEVRFTA